MSHQEPDSSAYGWTPEDQRALEERMTETEMFLDLIKPYLKHPDEGIAEVYPRMTPEDQTYLMALIGSWDQRSKGGE